MKRQQKNITLQLLKGTQEERKKVLKLVKIGLWQVGCEFYNPSGFSYDACLKGVSRKKYLDIIGNAFSLKSWAIYGNGLIENIVCGVKFRDLSCNN